MTTTIYVQVAVKIADNCDPLEAIQECDYMFEGDGILSHEIVDVTTTP